MSYVRSGVANVLICGDGHLDNWVPPTIDTHRISHDFKKSKNNVFAGQTQTLSISQHLQFVKLSCVTIIVVDDVKAGETTCIFFYNLRLAHFTPVQTGISFA